MNRVLAIERDGTQILNEENVRIVSDYLEGAVQFQCSDGGQLVIPIRNLKSVTEHLDPTDRSQFRFQRKHVTVKTVGEGAKAYSAAALSWDGPLVELWWERGEALVHDIIPADLVVWTREAPIPPGPEGN